MSSPSVERQQQGNTHKTPTKLGRRPGATPKKFDQNSEKSDQAGPKSSPPPQKANETTSKASRTPAKATPKPKKLDPSANKFSPASRNQGSAAKKAPTQSQSAKPGPGKSDEPRTPLPKQTVKPDDDDDDDDDADRRDGAIDDDNSHNPDDNEANDQASDANALGRGISQGETSKVNEKSERPNNDYADHDIDDKDDHDNGEDDVNDVDDEQSELAQADPEPIQMKDEEHSDDDDDADDPERKNAADADSNPQDDTAEGSEQNGDATADNEARPTSEQSKSQNGGLLSGARDLAGRASGLAGRGKGAANRAGSEAEKTANGTVDAAGKAKDGVDQAADQTGQTAKEGLENPADVPRNAADKTKDNIEKGADQTEQTAKDGLDDATDAVNDTADEAGDAVHDAQDAVADGAKQTGEDASEAVTGTAGQATDETQDQAQKVTEDTDPNGVDLPENLPLDKSVLKGLEVTEDGTVYDHEHNPIGKLTDGDAEDLAGYPIGDDGEILDEDGDLVGRVDLLPDEIKRQLQSLRDEGGDLPEGADEYLDKFDDAQDDVDDHVDEIANDEDNRPGLDILDGLTCQVDGLVYDADGNTIGKVVEGEADELQHATLNDQGEFIDDDGNVVGRAELHEEVDDLVQQGIYKAKGNIDAAAEDGEDMAEAAGEEGENAAEVAEEAAPDEIEDELPGIEALQGRELNEKGEVLDEEGNLLGGIEDEDLKRKITEGEIDPTTLDIDEQGQIVDADGNVLSKAELADGAAERLAGLLDFRILDGRKINKKGKILDDDGEVLAELTDGELSDCTGKRVNDKGEVFDKQGQLIGHVRVVPGEAAQSATRDLLEELGEAEQDGEEAVEENADQAANRPPPSILEGLKVNKKGQVLNEDGEPIGKLSSGELKDCAGKKVNDSGEVLDKDGNVIGQVETIPQETEAEDLSSLEGYKVNKKGQVINEDGEPIGELAEGELSQCAGRKINDKGEVLDDSGNVIGRVHGSQPSQDEEPGQIEGEEQPEDTEEGEDQLPPLSVLEGLTVNKAGNILDGDGRAVGRLVEGDPKKLSKSGVTCDAEGQFWDSKGHVIGRAETVPAEEADEEAAFAGLEGLHVVEEGWVQDANGHTVGYVTEGDAKKLIGREVDEDGDIIDKKGTVVGHANRYEPEAEEEQQPADLSFLQGKSVSKTGLVTGDDGVPVARLVEGNAKELTSRQLDDQGQFWNDSGKVIGRVELIPEEEREQKPEGPFAGLANLRVIKGGKVADEDDNVVGEIVEGNPRRLVGHTVDEDGDIIDKNGNVKGRAEPLPDEEETDYTILDGLTVNKQGNVVDSNGVPYGKLVEGNANELAGRSCDENGYIHGDTGKIIGRCEPIPEEERAAKPEGPFAGLHGLRVIKGGKIIDEDGNEVGQITEGDAKRLVGLSVDEDGDIIDKFGNTKGHAEPLEDEEEPEPVDNSILNNKTLNKQGYVVDESGTPIGRLYEGNPTELAGRKCDENGHIYGDTGKVVGRCEILPENERVSRPEGPFAGLDGLRVVKDGFIEDLDGNRVGQIADGDAKRLVGLHVDEDGDIIDKYGNVKGHAEPWSEEEEQQEDLSALAGTVINKAGYAVDGNGTIIGQVEEGNVKKLVGKKVDGEGQIWDDGGNVIGRCTLAHGVDSPEGPFAGFEGLQIQKDGTVTTSSGDTVGRIVEGDAKKLRGHTVDEDGDITDKNGNTIGRAERWEPEEKERRANPMSGRRVNKEGEIRDDNGDLIGRLTAGDLGHCVGQEIDDAGNVVDVDGNKIGEATLIENIAEDEYEGPSEEELAEAAKREEEREVAQKMGSICTQTLERMEPICKQITEHMERADRTPKEELDEDELVDQVKPLIEEGGRILQECNGQLRGLDPDGHIAAQAKGRAGTGEATPEEHRLAETLKELTTTVVTTIDNAKKKLNDMPHAKKKLNPLWALLTQPLFQILAAVGLLLAGVLGLVGQLLNALGLGGLVNGLLGGLGINKLLASFGLIDDDDGKKKKKKGGNNPLGSIPVVGGLLGGKGK